MWMLNIYIIHIFIGIKQTEPSYGCAITNWHIPTSPMSFNNAASLSIIAHCAAVLARRAHLLEPDHMPLCNNSTKNHQSTTFHSSKRATLHSYPSRNHPHSHHETKIVRLHIIVAGADCCLCLQIYI